MKPEGPPSNSNTIRDGTSVVMTGGHVASLERLASSSIDVCSIDNVTWGFFRKFRPVAAERYRILDETVSSPSLPFVTTVNTSESDAMAIAEALHEIMDDPQAADIREALQLAARSRRLRTTGGIRA